MAKNNNLGDFIKGLADKFRSKLSTTALINPQDFESKVDEVYNKGKQEEYDAFWDAFQRNGNRRNYNYAFFDGWTNANFAPKYDIIAELGYSSYMFSQSKITGSLKTILNNQGVTLRSSSPTEKHTEQVRFFIYVPSPSFRCSIFPWHVEVPYSMTPLETVEILKSSKRLFCPTAAQATARTHLGVAQNLKR